MPTRFSQHFAKKAAPSLVLQFGEPLVYHPAPTVPTPPSGQALVVDASGTSGGTGLSRSINGIVIRDRVRILAEAGDVPANQFIVRVLNDSTSGISSEEINDGGDEIEIPLSVGESAKRLQIVRVLNDNAGLTTFLVQ